MNITLSGGGLDVYVYAHILYITCPERHIDICLHYPIYLILDNTSRITYLPFGI